MKLDWLGIWALAIAGSLMVQPLPAAELTPEQAYSIQAVAYGQFHGPRALMEARPKIHIVDQAEICGRMHRAADCNFVGLFSQDSEEIYISRKVDFGTPMGASVLLHEIVHLFQKLTRGQVKEGDCAEYIAREVEAYRIQAHVLAAAGEGWAARAMLFTAAQYRCAAPYEKSQ
jgi:hypothetical protein